LNQNRGSQGVGSEDQVEGGAVRVQKDHNPPTAFKGGSKGSPNKTKGGGKKVKGAQKERKIETGSGMKRAQTEGSM